MDNARANARREGDESGAQEIPPRVQEQLPPQVPNDPPIGNALFEEFWASTIFLAQALTTQANRGEVASVNPIGGISSTRVREFLKMSPPEFYGSKVDEDPNGFIDEV